VNKGLERLGLFQEQSAIHVVLFDVNAEIVHKLIIKNRQDVPMEQPVKVAGNHKLTT
jgi:hypothetical protein